MSRSLVTIVGARPQFVKAAVVSRAIQRLAASGSDLHETLIHSGQHYDDAMSGTFFRELDMPEPAINLAVPGGHHGAFTGRALEKLEIVLMENRPDAVLVYGDTNTTLAGALAAAKLDIPLVHVEAGLRSRDRRQPEEINRVITDQISDLLFCPCQAAVDNLRHEGIAPERIRLVGDVMFDAVLRQRPGLPPPPGGVYLVATLHRAENTDEPERLRAILLGMERCGMPIKLALHPRTRQALERFGLSLPENVMVLPPLSHRAMLSLVEGARCVLTDSGGLQKEAFYLNKRCIVLRDTTEWTELLDLGVNRLTGADPEAIAAAVNWAVTSAALDAAPGPYGDGHSGDVIASILDQWVASPTKAPSASRLAQSDRTQVSIDLSVRCQD